jgi:hypothetical protein
MKITSLQTASSPSRSDFATYMLEQRALSPFLPRFIVSPSMPAAELGELLTRILDADIVCERAKNHYDPSVEFSSFDDGGTTTSGGASSTVQRFKDQFQPIHASMRYKMLYVTIVLPSLAYRCTDALDVLASSELFKFFSPMKSGTQTCVQWFSCRFLSRNPACSILL